MTQKISMKVRRDHPQRSNAGASGGRGRGGPSRKIGPLGGAVARVFHNISLAMCPLKLFLAPYMLDSRVDTAMEQQMHVGQVGKIAFFDR